MAIKVLSSEAVRSSNDAVMRFEREAQAAGRIGSEHIVEVMDIGVTPPEMTRRILVIEDEHVMRELLRLHLGSAGYSVEVAEDAISAGYALLKGPPDLIISDVEMPHMSGLELLAALRAEGNLARVPVIFLTSFE